MKNDDDKKFEKTDLPDRPDPGPSDPFAKEDPTELMLVAYLDDELESSERSELEAQIESDPALRRRLNQLRQAWSLLDELEACPPSQRFAETTLEMVALDAESHLKSEKSRKLRATRRRRNRIGLGLLASLIAGFLLIWFLYPSPDAALIKNLPIIAKLDQYEAAESVAFLEALVEVKLFPVSSEPPSDMDQTDSPLEPKAATNMDSELLPPVPKSAKLRREWIKKLEPVQKAQLLEYSERFDHLPPEQRDKLISLHEELKNSKQSELLSRVMLQYSNWLRRQPSFNRTKLLDLSASERIKELRTLRREELDRQGLLKWHKANRKKMETRLVELMRSPDVQRGLREQYSPPGGGPGRGMGPGRGPAPGRGPGSRLRTDDPRFWVRIIQEEDLKNLKQYLSLETVKEWDNKSSYEQRFWVQKMIFQMILEKGTERRLSAGSHAISDEELAQFFEKLPAAQQNELQKYSGDQLYKKLIELYQQDPTRRMHRDNRPENRRGQGRGNRRREQSLESDKDNNIEPKPPVP